jgi:hypothetical protein
MSDAAPLEVVRAVQSDLLAAHLNVVGAERQLREIVTEARRRGLSWDEIAAPLDVSKQAAHRRFRSSSTLVAFEDRPLAP